MGSSALHALHASPRLASHRTCEERRVGKRRFAAAGLREPFVRRTCDVTNTEGARATPDSLLDRKGFSVCDRSKEQSERPHGGSGIGWPRFGKTIPNRGVNCPSMLAGRVVQLLISRGSGSASPLEPGLHPFGHPAISLCGVEHMSRQNRVHTKVVTGWSWDVGQLHQTCRTDGRPVYRCPFRCTNHLIRKHAATLEL